MRIQLCLMIAAMALLAGCGDVIVFGHKVRQAQAPPAAADNPAGARDKPVAPMSGSVPTPASPGPVPQGLAKIQAIKAVTLAVAPDAVVKLTAAQSFDPTELQAKVTAELRARKLLAELDTDALGSADIVINQVTARPTVNAVVFGYQMMAGTLTGRIRLLDANAHTLTDFRVTAESTWSMAAGDDKSPLQALYRRFAVLVADRLSSASSEVGASAKSY